MRTASRTVVMVAAVGVLVLGGCGTDAADSGVDGSGVDGSGGSTTASESPSVQQTPDDDDTDSDDDSADSDDSAVEVEIDIKNGTTTPAGKRIVVKPGQTISLEVDSDMADELHLHADPEQSFAVKAAEDQEFEFVIEKPGVYELESHETGNQVISIQVQP